MDTGNGMEWPISVEVEGMLYYNDTVEHCAFPNSEERLLTNIQESLRGIRNFTLTDVKLSRFKEDSPFNIICQYLEELYNRKNHDYDNSFDQQLDEDGLLVAKIRLTDKIKRFGKLINSDAQVAESIKDTVVDLACYSIMTLMWMAKNSVE